MKQGKDHILTKSELVLENQLPIPIACTITMHHWTMVKKTTKDVKTC